MGVVGEIGSEEITYCRRVRYLEKKWILMAKGDKYYWIDQESVPIEKLKEIQIQDDVIEKQDLF